MTNHREDALPDKPQKEIAKLRKGSATVVLLTGQDGTARKAAARAMAVRLGLDLQRIELGAVVSKYLAETEKHLDALFDAAEAGGNALLFDEADAIFGKRGEVKDGHDRYANIAATA